MNTPLSARQTLRTGERPVLIGALAPLTRPGWTEAGRQLLAGLELAVRDAGEAGGIAGRPLELVVRDTAADPRKAEAAVDDLARLGVAAVAGEYHSVVARAAAARADALGVPFLCSSAVLDQLTERPTDGVARLAPAQSHGWRVYADFLLGAGHRRVAVAAEPSLYWASGTRILREYVASRGGSVAELDLRALSPRPPATRSPPSARRPSCCWPAIRSRWCRSSGPCAGTRAWPGSWSVRRPGSRSSPTGRRRWVATAPPSRSCATCRAAHPARRPRRGGPAGTAGPGALLRRVRGLRHGGRARRSTPCAGLRRGPVAHGGVPAGRHGGVLGGRRGRGHPRHDPLLPYAGRGRLAVGVGAGPGRRPGPGAAGRFRVLHSG